MTKTERITIRISAKLHAAITQDAAAREETAGHVVREIVENHYFPPKPQNQKPGHVSKPASKT